MNKIAILLVDNSSFDTANMDSALMGADLDYTLYPARSGKNGLSILMGNPYHGLVASDAVKIKPTVLILSKELKDIPALEFLGIVSKYYSLRDVKIFLLSDSLTSAERLAYAELGVSGYLQRPLDKEQVIKKIRPHLSRRWAHFAFIPVSLKPKTPKVSLNAFVKTKIMSIGVRAKIAACLVTTLVIGVMTMYNANGQVKEGLTAGGEKMPGQPSEQALTAGPLSLPPGETGPVDKKGPIRKNKPGLHRNEAVAGISPAAVSKPDSMKAASQKSESLLPSIARGSLRIVAVEVPDSIPGYSD